GGVRGNGPFSMRRIFLFRTGEVGESLSESRAAQRRGRVLPPPGRNRKIRGVPRSGPAWCGPLPRTPPRPGHKKDEIVREAQDAAISGSDIPTRKLSRKNAVGNTHACQLLLHRQISPAHFLVRSELFHRTAIAYLPLL